MKKKELVVMLAIILIVSVNFIILYSFRSYNEAVYLTGRGVTATISFIVGGLLSKIDIVNPQNVTYNFNVGDNYILDLEVVTSANASLWWYSHTDVRHNILLKDNLSFTPNTTFNAVRWSNKFDVYMMDVHGNVLSKSVSFFVFVPNSAPVIFGYSPEIYVCEGNYLSSYINISDIDEDILVSSFVPSNPFYLLPSGISIGANISIFELVSGVLDKIAAGGVNAGSKIYTTTAFVGDGEYSDNKGINITVLEINHRPSFFIGAQTIWTKPANYSFVKQIEVSDVEDGNQSSGKFNFTISFPNSRYLFNISQNGMMNFTPSDIDVGIYNVSVCATDSGLANPHPLLGSVCGQTGVKMNYCENFSFTITNINRKPTILSYQPFNLSVTAAAANNILIFNITTFDPDGNIPDSYWYVDDEIKQYSSGSSFDSFSYNSGCGASANHVIRAFISDGLENDSVQWSVSILNSTCVSAVLKTGGGGGGESGKSCYPKWVCGEWNVCQNSEKSLKQGLLSGEDYRLISTTCRRSAWNGEFCGFQLRTCFDLNKCDKNLSRLPEIQECYYTENPSCEDGIKNCHDGSCEFLVDCGGPCGLCSSCSDGIKNQGEKGIDCGGPCPWTCEEKISLSPEVGEKLRYALLGLIASLLMISVIFEIAKIYRLRKKIKK